MPSWDIWLDSEWWRLNAARLFGTAMTPKEKLCPVPRGMRTWQAGGMIGPAAEHAGLRALSRTF